MCESAEPNEQYVLTEADQALVQRAMWVLKLAMTRYQFTWAQKATVAKFLHIIDRLPKISSSTNMKISLTSPRDYFDQNEWFFWLDLEIEDDVLTLAYSGHIYQPSVGGDTFRSLTWEAVPGHSAQTCVNAEALLLYPGGVDAYRALDLMADDLDGYEIKIYDDENSLLNDSFLN